MCWVSEQVENARKFFSASVSVLVLGEFNSDVVCGQMLHVRTDGNIKKEF